jgi:hypothetical protein
MRRQPAEGDTRDLIWHFLFRRIFCSREINQTSVVVNCCGTGIVRRLHCWWWQVRCGPARSRHQKSYEPHALTDTYDESEGIFPDGQATLVECDAQNHQGSGHVDLWKFALDGSGHYDRLTHFSDIPNYKPSNPVVSDDGRFIAFQMAKSGEAAGVGHGLFLNDLTKDR